MTINKDYFRQFMSPEERTASMCACGHDIEDEHRRIPSRYGDTLVVCDECTCEYELGEREAYEASKPDSKPITIQDVLDVQRDLAKAKRCIEDAMLIMQEIEKKR